MKSTVNNILIAEDDASMRELLVEYLENAGYKAQSFENGQAAYDHLKENHHYMLVIADRNMPQMNGIELNDKMRQDEKLKNIPVIMQTGAVTPADISSGIRSGVYYYLTKPYEEEAIINLVRSAIRDRSQHKMFSERISRQNNAVRHMTQSDFSIKTLDDAQSIALLLGSAFPQPDSAVSGLYELLSNAIEHGNLGIGYGLKGRLLLSGQLDNEIKSRSILTENKQKSVDIRFVRHIDRVEVTIADQGDGFDWTPFLEIEPSRAINGNGRGIAKANLLSFNSLTYNDKGNQVKVSAKLN